MKLDSNTMTFELQVHFLRDEVLGQEDKMLTTYLKPELLIIDDMGMKQLPRRSGECLFEVVMRRYETRSTMMTSNRPLEDWGKLLGDVPSATAILDRFLHHAEIVRMAGRSYRLRHQSATEEGRLKTQNQPKRLPGRKRISRIQNQPKHPSGRKRISRIQNQPNALRVQREWKGRSQDREETLDSGANSVLLATNARESNRFSQAKQVVSRSRNSIVPY